MRIMEILQLRKSQDGGQQSKIDFLKDRINSHTDKLLSVGLSQAGREFLKNKISDDYQELKRLMPGFHRIAENFEVYNIKTGARVGGPYTTASRARTARERHDMKYGAYVHRVRPISEPGQPKLPHVLEAVNRLPLTEQDFSLLKEMMDKPIPAIVADVYIQDLINDDELSAQIDSIGDNSPSQDIRPLIVDWIRRVMPDQLFRFVDQGRTMDQQQGIMSPIHGYDPQCYKGTNDPVTGNAYGRF
jgi:hypothetical protein